jgi:hypothetical protein
MTRDAEFVAFSSGQNTSSRRAADLAMDHERAMISKPNNRGHPRRERRRSCPATRDLPLKFHPAAIGTSAGLIRYPSLDRRELEFSGLYHAGGLAAPAGVMRETGGLLPMAPCGRRWLYNEVLERP